MADCPVEIAGQCRFVGTSWYWATYHFPLAPPPDEWPPPNDELPPLR
jgi:hypothetical protein